jgi:heme exporter protein C
VNGRVSVLGLATLAAIPISLAAMLLYAPTERVQGPVQRVFYLHLPLAYLAYLSFFIVFVASAAYLWRGSAFWDLLGRSAAELGVLFTTLVLLTGSIWARPIWGTWWSWDARLTTTLVLWFIYLGYLMVRAYATDERRGARFAAVIGIIGFIDVPIIHQAVVWWRTLHPESVVTPPGGGGPAMPPSMLLTLGLSMVAFTLLFAWLLQQRYELERLKLEIRALRERRLEARGAV